MTRGKAETKPRAAGKVRKAPAAKKVARRAAKRRSPKTPTAPSPRTRVVFPMAVYEPNKDAIKAPMKELGMKWQYLGPGKGRYARQGAQIFVQFGDAGADFTVWGTDARAVQRVLEAWKPFRSDEATREAVEREAKTAGADARSRHEIAKPVRQPGEPEGFYRRRLAEWEQQDPGRKASGS